ncbi:2-hydroxy-3-oxopropionate reductase [Aureimonas endophytica]|uniref:2-hydroxy-3-oxopropionate reductase n=1 Tax=Aureimonas endophytica TaxID=2027858 RepID=A0A916ZV09_9HYPH|nr:dihydrofolate reductase family protein [Aureimonas endophytica]GGE15447.1 2-hydroxy-3-oxopropionate reductase [Aureimonas endophytica]
MKPHVICHMLTSVDGRILGDRWRPQGIESSKLFEKLHDELGGDAWIVGRVTGQEFAKAASYPPQTGERFERADHILDREAETYGVVIDAEGKIAWGRAEIGGDPIVVALTEKVSDAHLAGLRADGVSYVFAGKDRIDFALLLDKLNRELGIERLLLEGGGGLNGSFLRAGLIDELNLVVCPAVDGSKGAPSLFDSPEDEAGAPAPLAAMRLERSEVLEGGAICLRYRLENA